MSMRDRTTSIDTRETPKQGDLERIVRALEGIAAGTFKQLSASGGGVPAGNSRTVPVSNDRPQRLAGAFNARRQLTLQNQGASPVTIGHDNNVTFGQGIQIPAGATLSDDGPSVFRGEWWAIANVAGPVSIGVDDQGG